MSKKNRKEKPSSSSKKEIGKKEEKIDLSEYEEEPQKAEKAKIDYEEYEVPKGFKLKEEQEAEMESEEGLNWFQKKKRSFEKMDSYQRLYWIKVLLGCIIGIALGFGKAEKGWWLLLMVGAYAVITAGGYFLFKLKWNFKEVIFSGFFPYLAMFTVFWTLMYSSIYSPSIAEWWQMFETVITTTVNGTQIIYTVTNTTSAAGIPYMAFIIVVVAALGLMQFLLRRQKRKEEKN